MKNKRIEEEIGFARHYPDGDLYTIIESYMLDNAFICERIDPNIGKIIEKVYVKIFDINSIEFQGFAEDYDKVELKASAVWFKYGYSEFHTMTPVETTIHCKINKRDDTNPLQLEIVIDDISSRPCIISCAIIDYNKFFKVLTSKKLLIEYQLVLYREKEKGK